MGGISGSSVMLRVAAMTLSIQYRIHQLPPGAPHSDWELRLGDAKGAEDVHESSCVMQFLSKRGALALIVVSVGFASPEAAQAIGAWTTPVKLGPNVNGPGANHSPCVTADGQRLYFSAEDPASPFGSSEDVYVSRWDSSLDDWGPRVLLGASINTINREISPCESPDRQYLWFVRFQGGWDLYYSVWDTSASDWGTAQLAGAPFSQSCKQWSVSISPDGKRMFLDHGVRPGFAGCEGDVLWISYWNETAKWWDSLIWMGNRLNHTVGNVSASMSLDTTFFYLGTQSIFSGTYNSPNGGFYVVLNETFVWDSIAGLDPPLNSDDRDEGISVTADGSTLYIHSWRDPTRDLPDIYMSHCVEDRVRSEDSNSESGFQLLPPSPNPFNGSMALSFLVVRAGPYQIRLYNVLGRQVETLLDGYLASGRHKVEWSGAGHASGLYFVVVRSEHLSKVAKLLLVR